MFGSQQKPLKHAYEWLLMGVSFTVNEALTFCLQLFLIWMMGVTTKRHRTCVSGGGDERREDIYVNNFHFPSATVCITQHGSVVMVIATGQMMQKWVHLVMNLSSADGCLTHFETIHNIEPPPEGLQQNLKYTATFFFFLSWTFAAFSLIYHLMHLKHVPLNSNM